MIKGHSIPEPEPDDDSSRAQHPVQVITRVADILRALENEPDGLSLAQIAARVGLARSTVHRLTVGLTSEGFVIPASPNGRVRLGPALTRLGVASRRELKEELEPFVRRLADALEETIDVAVLDGPSVRFVDQIEGAHRLRAVSRVGDRFPLHCSANGKALLAALPREQAERLLPPRLEAFTPHTITSRAEIWKELDRITQAGCAFDREEHSLGICAVAAVVRDASEAAAALTVVVPTQRFTGNEQYFVDQLLRMCREVNGRLSTAA